MVLVIHGVLNELDDRTSDGALRLKPLDHVDGKPEANLAGVLADGCGHYLTPPTKSQKMKRATVKIPKAKLATLSQSVTRLYRFGSAWSWRDSMIRSITSWRKRS
jgi:hypothetical protein